MATVQAKVADNIHVVRQFPRWLKLDCGLGWDVDRERQLAVVLATVESRRKREDHFVTGGRAADQQLAAAF